MDIQSVSGAKNVLFGGEGLFNTVLTGPGRVWLQTMPINNVANAIRPYIPHGQQLIFCFTGTNKKELLHQRRSSPIPYFPNLLRSMAFSHLATMVVTTASPVTLVIT